MPFCVISKNCLSSVKCSDVYLNVSLNSFIVLHPLFILSTSCSIPVFIKPIVSKNLISNKTGSICFVL